MTITLVVWTGFILFVLAVVALDLGVFHREPRRVSMPEAVGWTCVWVSLALAFNVVVYFLYEYNPRGWDMDTEQLSGAQAALQFFTGYVVEKSLSVDNIFAIAMVFAYFKIPQEYQHRVLFWGIAGAVVLRAIMILAGGAIITQFDWIVYILGALLLYSAASMLIMRHDSAAPDHSGLIASISRFVPLTDKLNGDRFFVHLDGKRFATPLFLSLVLVETSDIMFAVDSIPAIFAITTDPFLVFTSNIFAILGLRSMYFVLAGLMDKFRYLKMSLVYILAFIGVKMLLLHHYPIPTEVSLAVIVGILTVGVLASGLAGTDSASLVSPIAESMESLALKSYREARRAVILVVGSTILVIGLAMILTPGPSILVIPAGLAILGIEFVWARRWLLAVRQRLAGLTARLSGRGKKQ